jgi:hypothetical protein
VKHQPKWRTKSYSDSSSPWVSSTEPSDPTTKEEVSRPIGCDRAVAEDAQKFRCGSGLLDYIQTLHQNNGSKQERH